MRLILELLHLLKESPEYLKRKLDDHKEFSRNVFVLGTFLGLSLWVWDYIVDPIGAKNTFILRLSYLVFIPFWFLFKKIKSSSLLSFLSIIATLFVEITYIEVLNNLNTGMIYGIAGFMFYLFLPLIAFQGFSLLANLLYTFLAVLIPHLMDLIGFADGFQAEHYAVLMWPAAVMTMLIQIFYAKNYEQRQRLKKALENATNTDPMTGVSNRRYFMPLLKKEIMRSRRFNHNLSLLMLDIDFFKKVNDTFGHPTGDLVICRLADICQNEIRKVDVVARMGGEEFAVLLPETEIKNAFIVAERIRKAVEKQVVMSLDNQEVKFTVSIGVAKIENEMSEQELINASDSALYLSKTSGRNCVN